MIQRIFRILLRFIHILEDYLEKKRFKNALKFV